MNDVFTEIGNLVEVNCAAACWSLDAVFYSILRTGEQTGAVANDAAGQVQFHEHHIEPARVQAGGAHQGIDVDWGWAQCLQNSGAVFVLKERWGQRWWGLPRLGWMLFGKSGNG